MSFDYYAAPSDEVFNEIKAKAIALWQTYSNEYGYVDEKVRRVNRIQNIKDSAWYILAMFDVNNQNKLLKMLEEPAKTAVADVLAWSREQYRGDLQ